ncbi:hypothetical protein FLJC2902T_31070 [Flavobacterium limnosediminis JC2902]|uniref:Lipoprotein n=1 Tax=Flavobacterium limnosediminis JC2902 TaxID=1341181 RepID=V6SFS3_9FLAO|nr:hypothetical protein [Flavobacterium limnosediminis]ESU25299.1 hypothetical protein FLJC2902T_31070 [Flavobacterium limnosediminis JC2902]
MKKILFITTVILFTSCATSISTKLANKSYQKLTNDIPVIVLDKNEELPSDSEFIGEVKIGDSGFSTDCGYNKVISDVTNVAKNSGANVVKITEIKKPSTLGSTCYRIKAKIYRNLNTESLSKLAENRNAKNKSRLPENSDYAIVHFYRPSLGTGGLLGFKIKNANDSIIGRLRNGEKFIYKTKEFGEQSFYGALETKEEVKINIEKGKEYFVRCAVTMGVAFGRPEIDLIENHIGIEEYSEMR